MHVVSPRDDTGAAVYVLLVSTTSDAHALPEAKSEKKIREQYDECRVCAIRSEKRKYLNSTTSAAHATPEAKTKMREQCNECRPCDTQSEKENT